MRRLLRHRSRFGRTPRFYRESMKMYLLWNRFRGRKTGGSRLLHHCAAAGGPQLPSTNEYAALGVKTQNKLSLDSAVYECTGSHVKMSRPKQKKGNVELGRGRVHELDDVGVPEKGVGDGEVPANS
jgi:hypothetical protein